MEAFVIYYVFLLEQPLHVLKPYFLSSGWTLPADGKQRINLIFSFNSTHGLCFSFIKLPLTQPISLIFFPHPADKGNERAAW